jgi:hypothetical protein
METKKCSKCNEVKQLSEYNRHNKRKDGLQTYCKVCSRKKNTSYYKNNKHTQIPIINEGRRDRKERNRKFVFEYLMNHPCVDCGETDPRVLEFDHRGDKIANVSDLMKAVTSLEKIEIEINKCDVRCANCHRRKTSIDQNWFTHKYLLHQRLTHKPF